MDSVEFLIKVNEQISGPVEAANAALSSLDSIIKKDASALLQLERSLAQANQRMAEAAETGNIAAYDRAKASVEQLTGAIDQKKAALSQVAGEAANLKGRIGELGSTASTTASGPFAMLEQKVGDLGSQFTGLPPQVAIAAGAVFAFASAAAAAMAAVTAFAFENANAHRSLMLTYEGLLGSAEAAEALDGAVGQLASSLPVTEGRLEEIAKSLALAGLKGGELSDALGTLGAVEAAAGQQASAALTEMLKRSQALGHFEISAKQLKDSGLQLPALYEELAKKTGMGVDQIEAAMKRGEISVADGVAALDAAVQSRFGGVLKAKMLDASFQFAKLKEDLGNIFEGVNVEPLLEGLHEVLSVFDANTASGKALAAMATTIFDGLFAAAGAVLPYVKATLNELIIAGLKLWIALKPLGNALSEAFGTTPGDGLSTFVSVLNTGLEILVNTVAGVAYGVAIMAAPFIQAAQAISTLIDAGQSAYNALAALDFGSIGTAIIDGLVGGIVSGTGMVVAAVQNLGASAMATLKSTLGIASPSAVFESFGGFTAEGFAQGVDAGAPDVAASVGSMVAMPKVDAAATGRAASTASGSAGGNTFNFYIEGVKDAADLEQRMPGLLAQTLEQLYGGAA